MNWNTYPSQLHELAKLQRPPAAVAEASIRPVPGRMDDLVGTQAVIPDIDIGDTAPAERGVLLLLADGEASMSRLRDALGMTKG